MTLTSKTTLEQTWTCDRCGETRKQDHMAWPVGWSRLVVARGGEEKPQHLCGACDASLEVWLKMVHSHRCLNAKEIADAVDKVQGERFLLSGSSRATRTL